jgi:L-threonylcarbamoyladenylate synthase
VTPGLRTIDLRADPEADLSSVVDFVRGGGVIAYPTETVYGLGSVCSTEGIQRVRQLKSRSSDKPLIVLVDSADSVRGLRWTAAARALAEIFWPGPVTLVLGDPDRIFPSGVRSEETGSVGVRVSSHPVTTRLVAELGAPLTSTSLNAPGEPPVSSGYGAGDLLQRLGGVDVFVLDAGTLPPSGPSTIVDCIRNEPVILREGTVPMGRLRCVIPEIHGQPSE